MKRITAKQKSARRRNIKVAQAARKRGGGRKVVGKTTKASIQKAHRKNIASLQAAKRKKGLFHNVKISRFL